VNWERHYTGIETADTNYGRFNLYMQRDTKARRVCFVRLSAFRRMIGVFIGRGNYVKGTGGFEVFTNRWHVGWTKPTLTWGNHRVMWSGSLANPYHTVTLRLGRFGIGRTTPAWLKLRKEKIENEKWEKQAQEYDALLQADYEYDEADDHQGHGE